MLAFRSIPDPFTVPPVDWLVTGLLTRGTYGQIAGPEKSLKSQFALALAVGIAGGVDVLGFWPVPSAGRVLMLLGEGGEGLFLRRLARICDAYGLRPVDLVERLRYTVEAVGVMSEAFRSGLASELEAFRPDLVILDPWYSYAPADVDARNLYQVGAALNSVGGLVGSAGASLLIVNHFNQTGSGMELRRITLAGHAEWCDSWLLLDKRSRPDVDLGRFPLRLSAGSRQWGGGTFNIDFDVGRFDVEANEHIGEMTWKVTRRSGADDTAESEASTAGAAVAARSVLAAFPKRGKREPLTKSDWLDRVSGIGSSAKRRAFQQLVDAGAIEELSIDRLNSRGANRTTCVYRLAEGRGPR